jgi:putative PIN family toxin of toxin-antitoxin system
VPVALIDTNVWVSAFINPAGHPAQLRQAWYEQRFEVVVSPPLLDELADVLTRPRITRKYPILDTDVSEFLVLLLQRARLVLPTGRIHECRDPDDDIVLETAILGDAEFVVSRDDDLKGDRDLIERLRDRGVEVVTVQQFLDRLAQKR